MGFLSGLLGGGSNQAKNKLANFMQQQQAMQYALAGKQMQKQLGDIETGYTGAMGNAGLGAGAAKQSVQDMTKQGLAGADQQALSRGLYNTTGALGMRRGIYSDAARSMSQINSDLANRMGMLQMQKAEAMAGARSNLANFHQNQSSAQTGMNMHFWDAMPAGGNSPLLQALGGLGGQFLGMYTGGLGAGLAKKTLGS
jgi:hypothetical protein